MGCRMPYLAWKASKNTGVPMWVICAFLEKETSGGMNVFGQDPTIYVRAGTVTKEKYLAYKAERKRTGKMQGVGPMQLTWWEFQDRADRAGGCWKPYINILTGTRILKEYRENSDNWWQVAKTYNGSEAYANQMTPLFKKWRQAFK